MHYTCHNTSNPDTDISTLAENTSYDRGSKDHDHNTDPLVLCNNLDSNNHRIFNRANINSVQFIEPHTYLHKKHRPDVSVFMSEKKYLCKFF